VTDTILRGDGHGSDKRNASKIVLGMVNNTNEAISVDISFIYSGALDKDMESAIEFIDLLPGESYKLPIPVSDFLLQSYMVSSYIMAHVLTEDDSGQREYFSKPLFYHFNRDYTEAQTYDADTLIKTFDGGYIEGDRDDPTLRLRTDAKNYREVAVSELIAESTKGNQYNASFGPTIVSEELVKTNQEQLNDEIDMSLDEVSADPLHSKATDYTVVDRICPNWKTSYQDSGIGDYYNSSGIHYRSAKYAYAIVKTASNNLVWRGYLNSSGCTPWLTLQSGWFPTKYTITITSQVRKYVGGGHYKKIHVYMANVDPNLPGCSDSSYPGIDDDCYALHTLNLSKAFYVTYGGGNINVNMNHINNCTRVSFTAGQILATVTNTVPLGTSDIYTGVPCESWKKKYPPYYNPQYSCYQSSIPAILIDSGAADWKFLVSHEFGHRSQGKATGHFYHSYKGNGENSLCKCDQVSGSTKAHCMQSSEYYSAAIKEGFAHFYATTVWNSKSNGEGEFGYYKKFLPVSGPVQNPPIAFDAAEAYTWRNNHCPKAGRGVEMDWMSFFWSWHTDNHFGGSNSKASMEDIYNVIKQTCGGWCDGDEINWNNFKQAAHDLFANEQGNQAKYDNFIYWAETHGVKD